ncbi:MAG: iron-containing alcohol dehydrogenase, partial [Lentisphaeria bacterium]
KFAQISRRLGGHDEKDCVAVIRKLLERLNLNITLSELGIKAADISWMVENCQKTGLANRSNAPRNYTQEALEMLYRKAL